jgi:hypothetical protein
MFNMNIDIEIFDELFTSLWREELQYIPEVVSSKDPENVKAAIKEALLRVFKSFKSDQ